MAGDAVSDPVARVEVEILTDPPRCRVIIIDLDGSRRWAWLDAANAIERGSALLRWGRGQDTRERSERWERPGAVGSGP
jgi:hypothetical protein